MAPSKFWSFQTQNSQIPFDSEEVRARKKIKPSKDLDLANIIMFSSSMKLDELPPELFDYIIFLVGCGSLEGLDTCRLVCSSWNNRIMRNLWENPNRQWGPIIRKRLERSWDITLPSEEKISKALELEAVGILPAAVMENLSEQLREKLKLFQSMHSLQDIRCAASLANKGLLGNVEALKLEDADLSSVPAQNLLSLVACVRFVVKIENDRGCDLLKILESVRSSWLKIRRHSLDTEETKTLVKALETNLERFYWWGYGEGSTPPDITAMTQYSGLGKCKHMSFVNMNFVNGAKYKEQFRTWAEGKDWEMFEEDEDDLFQMIRN